MRARGLRPRTFWLPDTSTSEFKEQARQDCARLNQWYREHPEELEDVLSLQHWPSDEEG